MTELQKELLGEIDAFRTLGHQFKNKEISAAEFKGKSGWHGCLCPAGRRTVYDPPSHAVWYCQPGTSGAN